jgi:peptidoglycan hydrolase-like protein with peptidoglycan-binding domain
MWNAQAELANMGYYNGDVDGVPGPQTRQAIADYQADNNLPVDGRLNPPTQVSLGLEPPDYAAGWGQ